MSASKIVFLKLLPQSLDLAANQHQFASEFLQSSASEKTAVVLNRTKEDFFTIQGYPSVPYKEKHKSWLLFRVSSSVCALHGLYAASHATFVCSQQIIAAYLFLFC